MKTFLVGGAVRDFLLNYPVKEKDWVVLGETPESMIKQGFHPVGKDFPVFLHPQTHEEYALARTERKTAPGYKGFTIHASRAVTLEQDLMRRDLTINAIAQDENGRIIDPYHGRKDLENRIFRHVSPAFSEDPVRILRVARFAARYSHLGFTLAEETLQLMKQMVRIGETDHLVAERVWTELQKIPFGTTISYAQLADNIGKPSAVRAVANANARNPIAIIIPCHRVIAKSGDLAGYAGGVHRKEWLLQHEKE